LIDKVVAAVVSSPQLMTWQFTSGARNEVSDRGNCNTEIHNQLFHASSPDLFFKFLRNVFAKTLTKQRPIASTPAIQKGSSESGCGHPTNDMFFGVFRRKDAVKHYPSDNAIHHLQKLRPDPREMIVACCSVEILSETITKQNHSSDGMRQHWSMQDQELSSDTIVEMVRES
jgi:hypothetical protein